MHTVSYRSARLIRHSSLTLEYPSISQQLYITRATHQTSALHVTNSSFTETHNVGLSNNSLKRIYPGNVMGEATSFSYNKPQRQSHPYFALIGCKIGRAIAHETRHWLLIVETRVQYRLTTTEIHGWHQSRVFSDLFSFILLITIPQLLHTHVSTPNEVCDSCHQSAYYHSLCHKLRASYLTRYLAVLRYSFIHRRL